MNKIYHKLRWVGINICRMLLSLVFVFSGFVKLVDPTGTQYKINDYLEAFGWGGVIPDFLILWIAVLIAIVEFCMGAFLFFGIRRRSTSLIVFLFMAFMTALTLYLAVENPISDCGCFGDAVKLTNWQTFYKNIVLLFMVMVVNKYHRLMTRFITERNQWIISLYTFVFALVTAGICLYHLPIIDFRPYRIGVNVLESMQIPEGEQPPVYETTYVLRNGKGEQREFSVDNYPQDTTWQYVDSHTTLVSEGYIPPIQDFALVTWAEGKDITSEVLTHKGYTFLMIAPYLEQADDANIDRINELYDYCLQHNYPFYCVTASGDEAILRWQDFTGANYPYCLADEIVLKTVVRSNPGIVLLKDGVIYGKWSSNDVPQIEVNAPQLDELPQGRLQLQSRLDTTMRVLLWFIIPLFLITTIDRIWLGSKMYKRMKHKNRINNLLKQQKKMRKKIVAGNWKMNLNLQEGVALATELNAALAADKPNCDVVICTPFIHLASVANVLDDAVIGLGAENCADKEKGAYTGEVSASMVKSTGAQYVILGHSERRAYYGETAEILKEKVNLALANGLKVIFCIGEVLEEREAEKQNEVVKAQLAGSLFDLSAEQFANIILAYEPVWAIGTGKTATAEQAEEMHAFIRATIAEQFGAEAAENVSILYGGSCKPSNAKEIFAKPDVDGGLIGGAALKCADFKGIIDAWKA